MTVSSVVRNLFQIKPNPGDPFFHGRSWLNVCGNNVNMDELRRRHAKNLEAVAYQLFGTINILKYMDVPEIRATWAKITRKLRSAGVVAWWIREVSRRSNRVHYHLITTSNHTADELKALIRASCPSLRFRLQFDPVNDAKHGANYLCKSTDFRGTKSFHAKKVVLFAEKLGLEKHGEIGSFWQSKPKKSTPQQKQAKRDYEHQYKEALNDMYVQDAATTLADTTGLDQNDIARHYARQLVADQSLYQVYAEDAYAYRIVEGDISPKATIPRVGTFQFTPTPVLRKPPVRTKPKPPTTPTRFDPAKCFTH